MELPQWNCHNGIATMELPQWNCHNGITTTAWKDIDYQLVIILNLLRYLLINS